MAPSSSPSHCKVIPSRPQRMHAPYSFASPWSGRWCQIINVSPSQDHLQLPPVPASSSMLATLEGTSDEHKVGAKIFRNAELVFRFNVAMRFTDEMLVSILDVMRTPGGKRFSANQWQAMLDTESSVEQPADISGCLLYTSPSPRDRG